MAPLPFSAHCPRHRPRGPCPPRAHPAMQGTLVTAVPFPELSPNVLLNNVTGGTHRADLSPGAQIPGGRGCGVLSPGGGTSTFLGG